MPTIVGLPGGAQEDSLSTTEVAVDLTALVRMEVKIWCDDADIWFSFAATATPATLTTSGDLAASTSALKADRSGQSVGVFRVVSPKYPFLIVKTASGTGTLHVKPIKEADGSV